jgi:hypothetical protein
VRSDSGAPVASEGNSPDLQISNIKRITQNAARLNGLLQFPGFRFLALVFLRQINCHSAMFRAMRRADVADVRGSDPNDIGAALDLAFGLEHPGFLFLLAISRPPIVCSTFNVKPRMRQGAEGSGEIIEALFQQFPRQRMHHLALQPNLKRSGPVKLAVSCIDRHHGMNQFMDEDAENLCRFRLICANEYRNAHRRTWTNASIRPLDCLSAQWTETQW